MPFSRERIREIVRLLGLASRPLQMLTCLGKGTAHRYVSGQIGEVRDETVRKLVDSLNLSEWQVRGRDPLPPDWPGSDPELSARIEALRAPLPRGRPPKKEESPPPSAADLKAVRAAVREAVREEAAALREEMRRELRELRAAVEAVLRGRMP